MSIEHDSLPVTPRLDTLLRQIVGHDLQPAQNQRVRARLGLHVQPAAGLATVMLPGSQPAPTSAPAIGMEAPPMRATPRARLRQQWLQFALAAIGFVTVGVVLALIFGSARDDQPATQPGVTSSPSATATVAPSTATTGRQDSPALPTPDEMGMYRGVTLEQAQAIVPFEIVMPNRVPDGLEPPSITVIDAGPIATGGRSYQIQVFFELSGDESPRKSVQFLQMSPASGSPNLPGAETTTTTINGIDVSRTTGTNVGGASLLAYWWENDGIGYQFIAAPEGDLTPGLVEDLMLSTLVPPAPTAEEQSALLEQERAEMMPFPVPDTCAADDWTGPDFRVRRSDAAAYFLDGDGLTLGTTHGVLFAGENEITWLADAPLTTAEALSGPESMAASHDSVDADPIPIEVTGQLEQGMMPDDVERAWWSTVDFPSEGCWEIKVVLGSHSLIATVYVYPSPPSGEFPQIKGAVTVDAAQLDSADLPFAASDAVGTIHIVEGVPNEINSYYSVPTQALREAGWSGGGFRTLQYASYSGWSNGDRIVLITVIPGGAQGVFTDDIAAIDLGPFADALDDVGEGESLIYTRTAVCEEATPQDCVRKAFEAVNTPTS